VGGGDSPLGERKSSDHLAILLPISDFSTLRTAVVRLGSQPAQAVGCGLWAVGCGLWAVGCGLVANSKKSPKRPPAKKEVSLSSFCEAVSLFLFVWLWFLGFLLSVPIRFRFRFRFGFPFPSSFVGTLVRVCRWVKSPVHFVSRSYHSHSDSLWHLIPIRCPSFPFSSLRSSSTCFFR